MKRGRIHTPLSRWMSAASLSQRKELALRADTSLGYLKILAHGYRENPRIRLALALVDGVAAINASCEGRERMLPAVTIQDLAAITRREE